jgi:hypothetical protein
MVQADRDQALDAIRAFHDEHGRLPRWMEWEHAALDRPCARTIERRWGWLKLMTAARGGVEIEAKPSRRTFVRYFGTRGRVGRHSTYSDLDRPSLCRSTCFWDCPVCP